MRWTEEAVQSRLRALWAIENGLPASTRDFDEERLQLMGTIAAVDSGAMTPHDASVEFDTIASRHMADAIEPRV